MRVGGVTSVKDYRVLRERRVLHSVISLFFSLVWTLFEHFFFLFHKETLNNIFKSKVLLGNFFKYIHQTASSHYVTHSPFAGSICGNDSSVVLLRSLDVEGHPVGVVSNTLFPEEMEELLMKVADLEDEEIFLLDERANIIASYPYHQVLK